MLYFTTLVLYCHICLGSFGSNKKLILASENTSCKTFILSQTMLWKPTTDCMLFEGISTVEQTSNIQFHDNILFICVIDFSKKLQSAQASDC